jgi:hypothetical protein
MDNGPAPRAFCIAENPFYEPGAVRPAMSSVPASSRFDFGSWQFGGFYHSSTGLISISGHNTFGWSIIIDGQLLGSNDDIAGNLFDECH